MPEHGGSGGGGGGGVLQEGGVGVVGDGEVEGVHEAEDVGGVAGGGGGDGVGRVGDQAAGTGAAE